MRIPSAVPILSGGTVSVVPTLAGHSRRYSTQTLSAMVKARPGTEGTIIGGRRRIIIRMSREVDHVTDLLAGLLTGISDEASLTGMAGSFNRRAEVLAADSGEDATAWANVYRLLALAVEMALLRRRTGLPV